MSNRVETLETSDRPGGGAPSGTLSPCRLVILSLLGLVILVAGGIGHGLWTDRWQPAPQLLQAAKVLEKLPTTVGSWKSVPYEQDPEALAMAGAVCCYSRSFRDPKTGESILIILLAGKPAQMVVHRPEHCYRSAGYDVQGKPVKVTIRPPGGTSAEMRTAVFSREESTGLSQLRIFWSWFTGERWEAPYNPRWNFARYRVLYKMYVIRSVTAPIRLEEDPCVQLLGEFLPVLEREVGEIKDRT
jgi:hypothetical protein